MVNAGLSRLRPFEPQDTDMILDASIDPLIPLITTVPAHSSHVAALVFIERLHDRLVERSGYWIGPQHRNRGTASAASIAITRWGLPQPGIQRLKLYVEPWSE